MEPVAFGRYELDEPKHWTFGYFGIYRFADLFYGRQCNDCHEEGNTQTTSLGQRKAAK